VTEGETVWDTVAELEEEALVDKEAEGVLVLVEEKDTDGVGVTDLLAVLEAELVAETVEEGEPVELVDIEAEGETVRELDGDTDPVVLLELEVVGDTVGVMDTEDETEPHGTHPESPYSICIKQEIGEKKLCS